MSVTPQSTKTVSMTGGKEAAGGPTPKNEFKNPKMLAQKQYFMSPTDAMVSPCTKKLQTSKRFPWKTTNHKASAGPPPPSKLADKENTQKAEVLGKMPSLEEEDEQDKEEHIPTTSPSSSTTSSSSQ